jgi:para-nitrobenzyl esterase
MIRSPRVAVPLVALLAAFSGACESDYEKLNDDLKGSSGVDASASPVTGADAGSEAGSTSNIVDGKPRVTLDDGVLEGKTEDNKVHAFLGIPYAKPPVGELRWKLPQKNEKWTTMRDATKFGGRCAQLASATLMNPASDTEDCLYLNVWTPSFTPAAPLPVMFWIHGGGNQNGSASEAVPYANTGLFYSGMFLAAKDVVVVTFNYRLGAFGFFAHPAIASEQGGAAGNQGLYDQALALEWVKSNIAKFGGNPNKVTIFGESAGSLDVCYHIASAKSRGLFHKAISQSGGCTTLLQTKALAQTAADGLAGKFECAGSPEEAVACLRDKSVSELLAMASTGFSPDLDGVFLTDQPRTLFDNGDIAKVPYIAGSNTDEGTLFVAADVADQAAYTAALGTAFGADRAAVVETQYPASKFPDGQPTPFRAALARAVGDARLVCTTFDSAARAATAGNPVFAYNFDISAGIANLGATHGSELTSVFGTSTMFNDDTRAASLLMQRYWSRFAKTGNPNGGDDLDWPEFTPTSNVRINFGLQEATVVEDFRAAECAFWRLGYDRMFPAK